VAGVDVVFTWIFDRRSEQDGEPLDLEADGAFCSADEARRALQASRADLLSLGATRATLLDRSRVVEVHALL
jgi:hypothetical protein